MKEAHISTASVTMLLDIIEHELKHRDMDGKMTVNRLNTTLQVLTHELRMCEDNGEKTASLLRVVDRIEDMLAGIQSSSDSDLRTAVLYLDNPLEDQAESGVT